MCSRGRCLPKDRFSSLPDDILLFIMSFLTFKEVVKTSILSRRWLNLWMHTLVIHFHTVVPKDSLINDKKRQKYVKWVSRVLRRHKGQYLTEFKIVCELDKRHQEDIDNWLLAALAKKVQCLELNFLLDGLKPSSLHNTYVFPGPFLNLGCGKANSNGIGGKSQFLQSDFKCLNSLSLKRVDVTDEAINFVLLNCPFLERLEVVGSVKLANLIISDPTLVLKYLKITHCFKLEVFTISNFNLVSLDISAVRGLTLTNLPMLVELFISGSCVELSHSISQASSCFSQLEAFKLSGFELKDITQLSNYSQLTKLKRLVIDVKAKGDDLTKLISIANYCPRLEEFVLMGIGGWLHDPWAIMNYRAALNTATSGTSSTTTTGSVTTTADQHTGEDSNANSSSAILTLQRLNGKNYLEWSQTVRLVIDGRGKLGYITGETVKPAEGDPRSATWRSENSMVRAWLINSMEPAIAKPHMFLPTARDMWNAVEEMYSDLENTSQIYELKTELWSYKQENQDVTSYYNTMVGLWQELDMSYNISWDCPGDGVKFQKKEETDRVYIFLAGLNQELDEVRGRILGKNPLPTLREVFSEVRREELRRKVMKTGTTTAAAPMIENSALMTVKGEADKKTGKQKLWCDHCKKQGHTRETCWGIHGKPANWKPRGAAGNSDRRQANQVSSDQGQNSTGGLQLTQEQLEHITKLVLAQTTKSAPPTGETSCSLVEKGYSHGDGDWQC